MLPCLALNYLGQGALIIADPAALANPFFLLGPHWLQVPMIILSTFATVIASQAGISGGFSLCRQIIQLGYLPRMRVTHTNAEEEGQIYLPEFNRFLMVGALLLVLAFRSSDALASAYGIAVTGTFMCTCVLAMVVFRRRTTGRGPPRSQPSAASSCLMPRSSRPMRSRSRRAAGCRCCWASC